MSGIGVMTAYNQILAAYPVRPSNMNEVWDYVAEKYPQYEEGIMIGALLAISWINKEMGGRR